MGETQNQNILYINELTGKIVSVKNEIQAAMLPKQYSRVEFTKNSDGESVVRMKIRASNGLGSATVDILSNNEKGAK